MKAILMSIRPQWVAKILNGEKTIEIRKKFPKDYVGWVYIYCTKDKKQKLCYIPATETFYCYPKDNFVAKQCDRMDLTFNGKVVARFWCDKVEEIICRPISGEWECYTKALDYSEIAKASCLENREIVHYLKGKNGYAIHITKLEIFDKPKDISEFKYYKKFSEIDYMLPVPRKETCERLVALTRAPESWCYVEV